MKKNIQIAIDGPVGAGKSTVAKLVADKLKILYVDTGAMYRAVAYYTKERSIDWNDEQGITEILPKIRIELIRPRAEKKDGRKVTILVNGQDVSWEVRGVEIGEGASVVSQYGEVRKRLVELQRKMAQGKSVIMEGRDIGTRVLPAAELKIYMDARVEERVKRKQEQIRIKGRRITFKEVKDGVITRDYREMNRKIDPLKPAKGAWRLDTTDLSIEQAVDKILARVAEL